MKPWLDAITVTERKFITIPSLKKVKIFLSNSFKPEALVHHEKACSKANPFKPLG